ncbi:non-haem dioxygenase in morphine synthesis N-terminal/2OG-Fe(II) oxygenase superfamily, putative [Angomonas deanei]|uniref:Non-haem dioxygenase in morphine synthesis N-terminal/2OG-Fe(II) oxygenase superfamily, putative n=1 Tax=Angomonas deanei TaxID=59799 RepID=A0A7G2CSD0_9TRYP|nr:non-haem dioxygenase in morphine synthesis N-terminal/2OG-Fe(II) oxygenase superfamily, putative [Angomonas deanei]
MSAADISSLPIIDISEVDNESTRAAFYKKLRHFARDIGFFYLVGHGIASSEREALLESAKEFFALPQDVKDKISMDNSPHFHGYTKVGRELTRNKADFREQLDIGHENPARVLPEDDPHFYKNLLGPNQWPKEVPELKERALAYHAKATALLTKLLQAFLVALEVPEGTFDKAYVGGRNILKLVHYPANSGEYGDSQVQGVGPHKDSVLLTLLWQDDVGGLQVYTDEKGWFDAPPIKDAFVINIGEALELATNGYLIANIHQVVMKPGQRKDRYSIPFFLGPSLDIGELPLLKLPKELQEQARGPSSDPLNPLFLNTGENIAKSRLRSHPNTTKRWYPKRYAEYKAKGIIGDEVNGLFQDDVKPAQSKI